MNHQIFTEPKYFAATIDVHLIEAIHTGSNAGRDFVSLSQEDLLLAIRHATTGECQTLRLIASSKEILGLWKATLQRLHIVCQGRIVPAGNIGNYGLKCVQLWLTETADRAVMK